MSSRLQGKVVVVTGAASGIGRAVTEESISEGARVVAADLNAVRLAELAEAYGADQLLPVEVDLATAAGTDRVIAAATEAGGADVLVNNAGIMDGFVPVGEIDDERWAKIIAVNTTAPMQLMRGVLPHMLEKGAGSIVNVASVGGVSGGASGAAYTASKHAVVGLTRSTAFFYGPRGVRCNAVCPGGVTTNIAEGGAVPEVDWAWERVRAGLGRVQRQAEPGEIASLVLYLASPQGVNVNGAIIASDGGWTAA